MSKVDHVATTPKRAEENCNAIKFCDLCLLFEKLSKAKGAEKKLTMIFTKSLKDHLKGDSIYPLLRLLLPSIDTERGKYGLKQAMIANTYVSALHLDKKSEDATRLLNWKDPSKTQGVELSKLITGEFGTLLEDVLKSRVRSEPSNETIGSVNNLLDQLANALNTEDKTTILRQQVLDKFNAQEQKWLVRIIFQDLKLGLRHENVLGRFYPNALRRYNECTNLRVVCEEEGLKAELMGVRLFTPFSPMLAKGFPTSNVGQVTTVEAAMKGFPFVMDLKLDGERILCHISDSADSNSFTLYTRRTNDYTDNYWPVVQNIITSLRRKGDFSCILDGEICAFDANTKKFIPFGNNLTVAKAEIEYGEIQPAGSINWYLDLPAWMTFVAFDLVFFDGADSQLILKQALRECGLGHREVPSGEITNLPLAVRRKLLEIILTPESNRVEIVPHRVVTSTDVVQRRTAIEEYFNQIVLDAQEGLVVKSLVSPYELGEQSRAFAHWVKMKPEYGDQTEDLDLLVLAGYHGEGNSFRGEGISTFLLGVRADPGSSVAYHTICKVGTGYNFDQLRELRAFLEPIAVPWDAEGGEQGPMHLQHWKIAKKDDRPHVYYPPEKTIAMQVKCAELVESISFSANITCRFPRVQRIRYDKGCFDVLTLSDIVAIRNRPRATVQQTSAAGADAFALVPGMGVKRDKPTGRGAKKAAAAIAGIPAGTNNDSAVTGEVKKRTLNVDDHFQLKRPKIDASATAVTESPGMMSHGTQVHPQALFEQLIFCVLDGEFVDVIAENMTRKYTREEIMSLIEAHGGQLVANASYPHCIVVAPAIGVPIVTTIGSSTVITRKVKKSIALQNVMDQGGTDVLDFRYLLRCVDFGQSYDVSEAAVYLLATSARTRHQQSRMDIYGDSYVQETQPRLLKELVLHRVEDIFDLAQRRVARVAQASTKKKTTANKSKALPLNQTHEEEQDEEKRYVQELEICLQQDFEAMKGKTWRDIVGQCFDLEDREPIYQQPCNILFTDPPIVVYFDLFADMGSLVVAPPERVEDSVLTWTSDIRPRVDPAWFTSLSVDRRDRLFFGMQASLFRLQSYGALVTTHLHSGVTHVLVSDGLYDYHRSQQQQQQLQLQDPHKRVFHNQERKFYETRWKKLQERLSRLRVLDTDDFTALPEKCRSSLYNNMNKEKRIVPIAWVNRMIDKQRILGSTLSDTSSFQSQQQGLI